MDRVVCCMKRRDYEIAGWEGLRGMRFVGIGAIGAAVNTGEQRMCGAAGSHIICRVRKNPKRWEESGRQECCRPEHGVQDLEGKSDRLETGAKTSGSDFRRPKKRGACSFPLVKRRGWVREAPAVQGHPDWARAHKELCVGPSGSARGTLIRPMPSSGRQRYRCWRRRRRCFEAGGSQRGCPCGCWPSWSSWACLP